MAQAAPVRRTDPRRLRALAGAALLVAVGSFTAAACGSQPAGSQGTTPPSSVGPGGGTTSTTTTTASCPHLSASTTASGAAAGSPVLDTAALLNATITVAAGTGADSCVVLHPGAHVHLLAGQRVEFVANHAPQLAGVPASAGTAAVSVSTAAGPSTTGPAGGPPTAHVVVTITAARPGTVSVTWVDCSGTAC